MCNFIQSVLFGDGILHMADSAVGEIPPQDPELTGNLVGFGEDVLDDVWLSNHFQIVNGLRHDACQLSIVPLATEVRMSIAGDEAVHVARDHPNLHAERKVYVHQACTWFVTKEHLLGRIKVFEARHFPQQRGFACLLQTVHLVLLLAQ